MGRRAVQMEIRKKEWDRLAEAAVTHMRTRVDTPYAPKELAQALGTNVRTLERAFQQATGRSLGDYARQVRLEKAQELLLETDLVLDDIAVACGYGDRSALTVPFRRAYGMTPGAWRQLNTACTATGKVQ